MFDFTPRAKYRKIIEEMRREDQHKQQTINRLKKELCDERSRHNLEESTLRAENMDLILDRNNLHEELQRITKEAHKQEVIARNIAEKNAEIISKLRKDNRRLKRELERAFNDLELVQINNVTQTNNN